MHSSTQSGGKKDVTMTSALAMLSRSVWLKQHRGVLAVVAREAGVSVQFVSAVYWGKKPAPAALAEILKRHGVELQPEQ